LSLRKQYPRWGKDKLVVLLQREKRSVSTSMVGRSHGISMTGWSTCGGCESGWPVGQFQRAPNFITDAKATT
jgi:hypothetical protein